MSFSVLLMVCLVLTTDGIATVDGEYILYHYFWNYLTLTEVPYTEVKHTQNTKIVPEVN